MNADGLLIVAMEFAGLGFCEVKCLRANDSYQPIFWAVESHETPDHSDIHANWPALRAVIEAESDADEILCLGDMVDYGPEPLRCVEWALAHVPVTRLLQGNHDWAVGWNEDPHCSPPYRHLAEVTRKHCLRVFTEGVRSFLCELWPQRSLSLGQVNCVACHAVPSDSRFRYLTFREDASAWREEVEQAHRPDFYSSATLT